MKIIFFILLTIYSTILIGQPKNDEVIPRVISPSPNAAAIEKFNTIPVDYSTGIPSISYPMWSWKKNKLEYNIGLLYHAGGYKIDDIASNVGMGWALTGAGRVSRTVRGIPDDSFFGFINTPYLPQVETYVNYNEDYNFTTKWYEFRTLYPTSLGITDLNSPHSNLISEINKNIYDGEQDIFSFNFNSLKGSFIISKDREVIFLEESNCKVEIIYGNNFPYSPGIEGPFTKFIITDDKGIQYNFEQPEYQVVTTYPTTLTPSTPNQNLISSWLITKIVDPQTQEEINFNYTVPNQNSFYESGLTQSLSIEVLGGTTSSNSESYSFSTVELTEPLLSEVILSDGSKVQFYYNFLRDDIKNSKALSSLKVFNFKNNLIKQFNLNYDYFSSGNYFYKPNWALSDNDFNKRLKLENVQEVSVNGDEQKITSFQYNSLYLNPRASFNQDYWGYNINPIRNNVQLIPKLRLEDQEIEMLRNFDFYVGYANRSPDEEFVKAGVLEKITYPTGGFSKFEFESNQAFSDSKYYLNNESGNNLTWPIMQFNQSKSLSFPGRIDENVFFRFQSIEENPRPTPNPNGTQDCLEDGQDLNPFRIEIYSSDLNFTTIIIEDIYEHLLGGIDKTLKLPLDGNYTIKFIYNPNTACSYKFPFNINMLSEYFIEKFDKPVGGLRIKKIKSNNGLTDTYVTEYNYNGVDGKSSGTIHAIPNYKYSRSTIDKSVDPPTEPSIIILKGYINIKSSPSNTLHYFNGGPLVYKNVTETKSDGSSIYRIYDDLNFAPTGGPIDRIPFVPIQYFNNFSGLILNEYSKDANHFTVSEKKYTYQKDKTDLLNQDKNRNLRTAIFASTDGTIQSPYNYDATYYMCFQFFYYKSNLKLTQTVEKQFERTSVITNQMDYQYNQKNYISEKHSTNSKNENIITSFNYPFNSSASSPVYSLMEQRNMLSLVTNQKQVKNTNQTNELLWQQTNNYQNFNSSMIMPSSVETKLKDGASFTEVSFQKYDTKGNIRQYTGKDGIVHTFIWGYNNQYPVAHIIGADYESVKDFVNETLLNNSSTTSLQITNELNSFRTAISNMKLQVTTYTYIPLIGLETITDINGKKMTYEYDNFYRLKSVRDNDGNILSAQEYQYAP